jgi:1-acyl-sn-glycerol-3-phosphate acyltransferase
MPFFRHLVGLITTLLFLAITLLALIPLLPLALMKRLVPFQAWQIFCNRCLDWIASTWVDLNSAHQAVLTRTRIQVEGDTDLRIDEWYMMIANHQSWVDILVLLRVFNGRIPYVKFFLKKSLIWVPLLGIAWWALEFPFMRRYTKEEIVRNPQLKGRDVEETRRACEKYRYHPVTIINYLEGTRFTPEKHAQQKSPYQYLLIPKAGGLAFTLAAMDGQLHSLLDITIYYPAGRPSYWEYASGKVRDAWIHVRQLPIPDSLLGDYANDAEFRQRFQHWVNERWREKDALLSEMVEKNTSQ